MRCVTFRRPAVNDRVELITGGPQVDFISGLPGTRHGHRSKVQYIHKKKKPQIGYPEYCITESRIIVDLTSDLPSIRVRDEIVVRKKYE